jgi:hypothetical protein
MTKNITFTNVFYGDEIEKPQPASKFIPEWYKNTDSYITKDKKPNGIGSTSATIKRCMPVFDAINAGYIITSPADVWVSVQQYTPVNAETKETIKDMPTKKTQHFEWSSFGLVQFHPIEQAPEHPAHSTFSYPKWMNPWSIKTPSGYSCLFVHPMHHDLPFTIMPGIVDTDKYVAPVNFPFTTNDPDFEGLIPAGTPIAQVIPFKRENWQMNFGSDKELQETVDVARKLEIKFFDRYKNMFRSQKSYT